MPRAPMSGRWQPAVTSHTSRLRNDLGADLQMHPQILLKTQKKTQEIWGDEDDDTSGRNDR